MKNSINIILFEPLIAENTGNIARSCVAFNVNLHLIRPYGFFLSGPQFKRASVNYWQHLSLFEYDTFEEFLKQNNYPEKIFIYTRYGNKTPDQIKYAQYDDEIYVMFGKETTGIPKDILERYKDFLIRIPTSVNVRSLNLSNTVAIAIYEILRQHNFDKLEHLEPHKK